jgi:hypothetical protein
VFHAVWIYLAADRARHGVPLLAANWRFATFITWPHLVMLAEAICVRLLAWGSKGLDALGVPDLFSIAVAPPSSSRDGHRAEIHGEAHLRALPAVRHDLDLAVLAPPAPGMGSAHRPLCAASGQCRQLSEREEIVLVGHSSGSFLGVEILARALKLDPALGRHGPRIVLLTIGGNFPIVGFHALAGFPRPSAAACGRASIDWIDCQARKDVMNFFQFDPLAAHGIDVGPRSATRPSCRCAFARSSARELQCLPLASSSASISSS